MDKDHYRRIVIIGLGGGWRTPGDLAFFLAFHMPTTRLVLVDGKNHKTGHKDHEFFEFLGNRARIQAERIRTEFPDLSCECVPRFVGVEPRHDVVAVADLIGPGDVVILQVDNNRTKQIVDRFAQRLNDISVISGGTNQDQLRIQLYLRRNGTDITPPFSTYCHDIAVPGDELPKPDCPSPFQKNPGYVSEVRHPFTLMSMSTFLVNAFYQVCCFDRGICENRIYFDLWFDIGTGRCRTEWVRLRETMHGGGQKRPSGCV
jgi:hypothetical protein